MAADDDWADSEADDWTANRADKVPIARDPIATVIVAGYPGISGAWARGHIGHRAANGDSKLSGLGCIGAKAQSAGNESCT
jgi:hypothetical protein